MQGDGDEPSEWIVVTQTIIGIIGDSVQAEESSNPTHFCGMDCLGQHYEGG